jgi:hypothetical protein
MPAYAGPARAESAEGRADTRHDRERHARRSAGLRLFAAAAEYERVAAFQPDDTLAFLGPADDERLDFALGEGVLRCPLADEDAFGTGGRVVEQGGVHERVVEDDISAFERAPPGDGDQPRITGAGAHDPHVAGRGFALAVLTGGGRPAAGGHHACSRIASGSIPCVSHHAR